MNEAAVPTVFSERSLQAGRLRPGRELLSSTRRHWRSVLLQTFEQPGTVEAFETAPSPDHLFVFSLQGRYRIESLASGTWVAADYQPGLGGYTSPLVQNRLRWRSDKAAGVQVLRLYVPDSYFQEAAEEFRPVGGLRPRLPDCLLLSAPTAFHTAKSLLEQMHLGAPDLYADAGARFLAAHLLSDPALHTDRGRARSTCPDHRLQRALEFLQHHFREELTLPQIAREAGISPFHFSRAYKAKFGYTPHRHQTLLRVQHARTLLLDGDLPVQQIASECGYAHGGHFAAAFRAEFGVTPLEFRKRLC